MNKKLSLSGAVATTALAAVLIFGNSSQAFAATIFTRDLTLGSSGSDVISLQTLLIGQGFAIPAGATGYFGAQTQAALASYQAAHAIVPAAGYFGAITRAAVNATDDSDSTDTNDNSNQDNSDSSLSGGEASLRNFKLVSGDDLAEGDTNKEIAVADFDVKGGDVRVQRVTIEFTAQNSSLNAQPWKYIDTLSVYNGSKKVGSASVDSKNDWDKDGTTYAVDIPVDVTIKSGKTAELSVHADAQDSIDSANQDQTFKVVIPSQGIRAVDSEKIQNYTGKDSDSVTLGFSSEENGKLSLRESSDNPEAGVIVVRSNKSSDKTDVLGFELRNSEDADVDVTDLTVRVDAGFASSTISGEDVSDIIRRATLKFDGKTYTGRVTDTDSGSYEGAIEFTKLKTSIDGDDTVDGTLTIEVNNSSNHYDPGATLSFDILSSDIEAEGDRSGDTSEVNGTVTGNEMTVVTDAGINLNGRTNTATVHTGSNDADASFGTFTLKFDVTATGDQVFVPRSVTVGDDATSTEGVHIASMNGSLSGSVSAILTSTATKYNDDYFIVREGDTETFTATIVVNPTTAGYYQLGIDYVQFSPVATGFGSLQKLEVNQNKTSFNTDPLYIPS